MASNVIFLGWNRAIPGRERIAGKHFQEFVQYLGELQQKGAIQSFDTVLLNSHGGDLNGFFLIRAENAELNNLMATDEWLKHIVRGELHEEGMGVIGGITGELAMERIKLWTSLIPE